MKYVLAAIAASLIAVPAVAADTVVHNSAPAEIGRAHV